MRLKIIWQSDSWERRFKKSQNLTQVNEGSKSFHNLTDLIKFVTRSSNLTYKMMVSKTVKLIEIKFQD
nr:hypothetical protein [Mycoplasmopsis bovis]